MEPSMNELKEMYSQYINTLCRKFKIIEQRSFSQRIAEHIKERPLDIEIDSVKQKWNEDFFAIVMYYSALTPEELEAIVNLDLQVLMTTPQKD